MKNNFCSRLDLYMQHEKINDHQITIQAQLAIGAIGKLRKGGHGLSVANIEKILLSHPELSADWLLTGRGEMIQNSKNRKRVQKNEPIWQIADKKNERIIAKLKKLTCMQEELLNELHKHSSLIKNAL